MSIILNLEIRTALGGQATEWRHVLAFESAIGPMLVSRLAGALLVCAHDETTQGRITRADAPDEAVLFWSLPKGWVTPAPQRA